MPVEISEIAIRAEVATPPAPASPALSATELAALKEELVQECMRRLAQMQANPRER